MSDALAAVVVVLAIVLIVSVLCALPMMLLWNWLMPDLFGLQTIGFWQACGLLVLSSLLFGNTNSSKSN